MIIRIYEILQNSKEINFLNFEDNFDNFDNFVYVY